MDIHSGSLNRVPYTLPNVKASKLAVKSIPYGKPIFFFTHMETCYVIPFDQLRENKVAEHQFLHTQSEVSPSLFWSEP